MTADRRTVLALSGAILAGVAGCTSDGDTTDDGTGDPGNGGNGPGNGDAGNGDAGEEWDDAPAFPEIDPVTEPAIETGRLARQVRGNVAFSLALLARLREEEPDANLFFSPYSVSVALAMTYAGADSETADEMREALRYELGGEDLHTAFGALEDEFERRNEDGEATRASDGERTESASDGEEVEPPEWAEEDGEEDDLGFQFSSANALWAEERYPFDDDYFALLERYYGAGEHTVDFRGDPEGARREINDWVEERTNDRIEDLLSEDTIDERTRLVLTNAVYFLAAWEHDFDPAATAPEPFTSLDGTETEVEMMHQIEEFPYAEVDGHQLVELPYANGDTSMVVLLPAEGEFERFEESFSVDRLATMLEAASPREVDLGLPTFGIESEFSLVETMQSLGMERAFTEAADLGDMVEGDHEELYVDDVVHQSFLEVDEEGTEAAAATAVVVSTTAAMTGETVEMTVDRPFLFYVRDRPTETPLFLGRVVDGGTLQDG
ncbi:serpin family protein [Halopiger goleimassiliensis]|uniref:serpin family protein n=1 Tax=Halopiger goleimassiliensis TaxID=1293048 RepID=UPI000677A98D|nr:serpin family protein [Halopiger goleimassiliensis]